MLLNCGFFALSRSCCDGPNWRCPWVLNFWYFLVSFAIHKHNFCLFFIFHFSSKATRAELGSGRPGRNWSIKEFSGSAAWQISSRGPRFPQSHFAADSLMLASVPNFYFFLFWNFMLMQPGSVDSRILFQLCADILYDTLWSIPCWLIRVVISDCIVCPAELWVHGIWQSRHCAESTGRACEYNISPSLLLSLRQRLLSWDTKGVLLSHMCL